MYTNAIKGCFLVLGGGCCVAAYGGGLAIVLWSSKHQAICAVATKALSNLCAHAWISANTCKFFTAYVIQNPLAAAVILKSSLIIAGATLTVIAAGTAQFLLTLGKKLYREQQLPQQPITQQPINSSMFGISCEVRVLHAALTLSASRQAIINHADACLKTLTFCLRKCQNLNRFSFNVQYVGERAIDAGGPSREFFSTLLFNLARQERANASVRFLQNEETGYYDASATSETGQLHPADKELCQSIGVLFGAMLTGFMESTGYKLGSFFPDRVYAGLTYLHQQREVNLLQKIWRKIFSRKMEQKEQKDVCLVFAQASLDHPLFALPLIRLSFCHEWNHQQKAQLLTALLTMQNVQLALEEKVDLPPLSQEALEEGRNREKIKNFIEKCVVDQYGASYAPLCSVLKGIEQFPGTFIKMRRFVPRGNDISILAKAFAERIQGRPFTRDGFLRLLPNVDQDIQDAQDAQDVLVAPAPVARGVPAPVVRPVNAPAPLRMFRWIQNRVRNLLSDAPAAPAPVVVAPAPIPQTGPVRAWVVEWLRNSASEEEQRAFLKYVTGHDIVDERGITITINPNGIFSSHTCFHHLEVPCSLFKDNFIEGLKAAIRFDRGFNAA